MPKGGSTYGDRPGPKGFTTVVLDAGHGGKDSGARTRRQSEKEVALDITRRVQADLQKDFRVVLTRTSDSFIALDSRVRMANRDHAVAVSIHLNYGSRRLAGPETYYWRTDSHALAKRLQRNLSAAAPYESRNRGLVRRRLRLTRNPLVPCVLVECGYLTNSREGPLLATSGYRDKLARAIAGAIREQAAHGDAGMGPLPAPIFAPPSSAHDARDSF